MASKSKRSSTVFYAIAMLIIGILLLVGGASTGAQILSILITVMGVILIVLGVLNIAWGAVPLGAVQLIFGILIIVFGWTLLWVAFTVLGVVLVAYGLMALTNKYGAIGALVDILVGIMFIMVALGNRLGWSFFNILCYVTGGLMVVDSVLILIRK